MRRDTSRQSGQLCHRLGSGRVPKAGVLAVLATLTIDHAAYADCLNGPSSLRTMAARKQLSFSEVPSDVLIDRGSPPLRVVGWPSAMQRHDLPFEQSYRYVSNAGPWALFGIPVECRVQTKDGRWWLVFQNYQYLSYTLELEVESRIRR